jgi:IS30 family transposase
VCAKTIYTFIKKERAELTKYLREKGKKRRQRVAHPRGPFRAAAPEKRTIHERPEVIEYRADVGHWEADLILSARGSKKAILSLVDRATREKIFRLIPDHTAQSVLSTMRAILFELPPERRQSITLDNGGEFSYRELIALERAFPGLQIYYCDPYCSWQKGSVERSNREFRGFYPKGTSFESLTSSEVRRTEALINAMPLKCLGYETPLEMRYYLAA